MKTILMARKAAGLTQEQLAARLGVTQGAIAQWENGITHPSYRVLKPLSEALGLSLDELLSEGGEHDTVSNDPAGGGSAERVG